MNTKDMKIKKFKVLQANILERAMTAKEYADLMKRYQESRRTAGGFKREEVLSVPISSKERYALKRFLEGASKDELCDLLKRKMVVISYDMGRIALKILYQDKEMQKLIGGERA